MILLDDKGPLQRLVDELADENVHQSIRGKWPSSDVFGVYEKNGFSDNRIRGSEGDNPNSVDPTGQEHHVGLPEHQAKNLDKDHDLIQAAEIFLKAKR